VALWGTENETGAPISEDSWGVLVFLEGSDVPELLILKDGGGLMLFWEGRRFAR
jgi:hypothetical protein